MRPLINTKSQRALKPHLGHKIPQPPNRTPQNPPAHLMIVRILDHEQQIADLEFPAAVGDKAVPYGDQVRVHAVVGVGDEGVERDAEERADGSEG